MAKGDAPQQTPQKAQRRRNRGLKKINDTVKELEVIHRGKKIRLMFQDEAGFGRINKPRYCWCQKGIRSSVPCHHILTVRHGTNPGIWNYRRTLSVSTSLHIRLRWIQLNRFGKRSESAVSVTRFSPHWKKLLTACVIPFAPCLTMSFPALRAEIG